MDEKKYELIEGATSDTKPSAEVPYGENGMDVNFNIREEAVTNPDGTVHHQFRYDIKRYLSFNTYYCDKLAGN